MRTLVHLSDMHFGKVDTALLEPLRQRIVSLCPQLLVVSGDLTQRARTRQFREAREFLDSLPGPRIVVPGNHDVPLYNVYQRFFKPLDKYRRYITNDLEPTYVDDEIAVIGVNTARSLTVKDGRINEDQIRRLRAFLGPISESVTKIIVSHHPFDLPVDYNEGDLVGRAPLAMLAFARCGADVLLSGHLHVGHALETGIRYSLGGYSALVVQAGTATSVRRRGAANSFNALTITRSDLHIVRYDWDDATRDFLPASNQRFEQTLDEQASNSSGGRWTGLGPGGC